MNRRDLEKVHVAIPRLADELESGKLNRREFLRTTSLLGLSATAAYAMAGAIDGQSPVKHAVAADMPKAGGTLRCSMRVQEMTDPASFNWSPKANVSRQFVEYLAITGPDNITRPYLLESWEATTPQAPSSGSRSGSLLASTGVGTQMR